MTIMKIENFLHKTKNIKLKLVFNTEKRKWLVTAYEKIR